MIYIKDLMSGIDIFKALGSEIRIQILEMLASNQELNLNEIAKRLNLSNGAITMHIKKLEESGLIEINTSVGKHGIQKVCYLNKDRLMVDLRSKDVDNLYEVEIQVGHYSNYAAVPTCGLATKDSIIGDFDEPRYFADPQRINSEIVWMAEGFLEYRIPNYLKANQSFREIQFSMELGSEAPGFSNNYPSDIYFYLNGVELGCWTSPGDFGDVRGTFNPDWWPPHLNQYGMLKLIRINNEGSFIDGCRISDVTLDKIQLDYRSELTFRIAVTDQSVNKRGLTIYGKHFGNYSQDLLARVLYDVHEVENIRSPKVSTAE
ncbi:helix-turn-helix domain-containing protein [Paenibacillus sp. HN-1]|uniref:ArsR/SmtB family transcription factor n=1 Tax=Paenibacillus TaxID=44249 RepID=UPI001CA9BCD4|nr:MULTISPECIES: winged helix-turn-helix transcriptional regulator [Paenibacillus]MBY9080640.1 helix-turn-helix domain-containing protein [Paenibacillus sp. CGMCC 1.18879]MBY9085415.1 helix-turn-helix domain-containing protein [Paenibacillus sinensis]